MKTKLIFVILLSAICLSASAQKFNGGLILGFSGSQVAGDTYSGYNKFGIFGGGFVNFKFLDLLTLQLEMEYVQKGSRHNPNVNVNDVSSYKLNLDYVEVPLIAKLTIFKGLKAEVGLAGAVLINSYEEINGNSVSSRAFQSMNYSTILGIAFNFTKKFTASLRTSDSITPIRKVSNSGDVKRYFTYGQWHDLLTLSVQYQFR
ncbi:MAG: porin family protein [Bacteroidota bacterium]